MSIRLNLSMFILGAKGLSSMCANWHLNGRMNGRNAKMISVYIFFSHCSFFFKYTQRGSKWVMIFKEVIHVLLCSVFNSCANPLVLSLSLTYKTQCYKSQYKPWFWCRNVRAVLRDSMMVRWSGPAHLLLSHSSLTHHLPCLPQLVLNVHWLLNGRVCTEEQMGNFNEMENLTVVGLVLSR